MLECFLVDDLRIDDLPDLEDSAGASAGAAAPAPVLDCFTEGDLLVDDLLDCDDVAGASAGAGAPAPVLDMRWAAIRWRCSMR